MILVCTSRPITIKTAKSIFMTLRGLSKIGSSAMTRRIRPVTMYRKAFMLNVGLFGMFANLAQPVLYRLGGVL